MLQRLVLCALLLVTQAVATSGVDIKVEAWCADSLRVRIGQDLSFEPVMQGLQQPPSCRVKEKNKNGNIQVTHTDDGQLAISRVSDGRIMLETTGFDLTSLNENDVNGNPMYSVSITFKRRTSQDHITGFGEHRNGVVNYGTGYFFLFEQSQGTGYTNGDITLPVYHSSDGYSFLWNTPSFGSVTIQDTQFIWTSNATNYIDFWVSVTGSEVKESSTPYKSLVGNFVAATGHPSNLPQWASGFIQCKLRYRNQQEVLDAAYGYVNRGIPISMIVIDYFHWNHCGDWSFNSQCYPNPKSMVDELLNLGIEVMVSVWPAVSLSSVNFAEMSERGLLVNDNAGKPFYSEHLSGFLNDPSYIYDAFQLEARDFMFHFLNESYISTGIDHFWLDASEPEGVIPGLVTYGAGRDLNVALAYPREHQRGIYENSLAAGIKDPVSLSRSTWIGGAAYGGAVWSGDIQSDFESLSQQIRVAISMSMSGVYLWTTDIGGFFGGDESTPVMQELIVRWFQFGAFCPLFRLHGDRVGGSTNECGESGAPNEVWTYGDVAYEILRDLILTRENLRGYIHKMWKHAQITGVPLLRPLIFDHTDAECFNVDDQFIFGDHFLVAPVYVYQARSRDVYLPQLSHGNVWVYFYDMKQTFNGGEWLRDFPAPLNEFPLFFKAPLHLMREISGTAAEVTLTSGTSIPFRSGPPQKDNIAVQIA